MNTFTYTIHKTRPILSVAAIAAATLCPCVARATPVNLGTAANYAVVAINSFQYNGPGSITGNVAVGQSTNFATPAVINGTVYENSGVPAQGNGNVMPTGGFMTANLSQVFSDAQAAATAASKLAPTQNLGAINNAVTITGGAGQNVIDVTGVNLTNGDLILNGSANSTFIINDTGVFTSSNSDIILTGGLTAGNVLFNVTGNVAITGGGGNNFYGVFLAPNSDITVHDKNLNGELIGATIEDTSGFTITGLPGTPPPTAPEPQTYSIAGLGLLMLAGMAFRRRKSASQL